MRGVLTTGFYRGCASGGVSDRSVDSKNFCVKTNLLGLPPERATQCSTQSGSVKP